MHQCHKNNNATRVYEIFTVYVVFLLASTTSIILRSVLVNS
uniref:Uncharacterized protein n=1 Tax=Arundo donax TaxID=35708 RepID=A0A0A9AQL4_ARUDO